MSLLPDLTEPPAEPYDLGQSPADIVVISALATDIAALSEARAALSDPPSLRLAHLHHLRHPASVDQHLDACATRARLVIARLPDGGDGWPYGLAQLGARCASAGVPVALLPCGSAPEPRLQQLSTAPAETCLALHHYLDQGGPDNAQAFLLHCQAVLSDSPPPALPPELPRSGLYWPGEGRCTLDQIQQGWQPDRPVAALLFARALVHGAGLHPVNRMIRALLRAGLNPLPVFVGDAHSIEADLAGVRPAVILSCLPGSETPALPGDIPVLNAALTIWSEADWIESANGLPPRDIAEHALLPSRAGQIITRAIGTTDEAYFDNATECPVLAPRALGDRVDFTAQLTAQWAGLLRTPRDGRRVALVLDSPQPALVARAHGLLRALKDAGYDTQPPPGPDGPVPSEPLSPDAYQEAFGTLPWPLRDAVERRWGAPEDDPDFTPGTGFCLPLQQCGRIVLAVARPGPDNSPPSHRFLALHFWLRQVFGAQALVHLGGHGGLGALPGKALALSADCWPEQVLGPTPHIALLPADGGDAATLARNRLHALCLPPDGTDLIDALDGKAAAARVLPRIPDMAAWRRGQAEADAWIEEHLQRHGDWPRATEICFRAATTALSCGADVARALSLMGFRTSGTEAPDCLTRDDSLSRPPVAVTPRVAPCFRRAFPELVTLLDTACRRARTGA